jgi:hypothetical protein
MKRRAPASTEQPVPLGRVASRKLREVLRQLVVLPEGDQDQVADAVEGLLEQLQLSFR